MNENPREYAMAIDRPSRVAFLCPILAAIGLGVLLPGQAPAETTVFCAGAATVKITPAVGTPMAGYYGKRGVQGVLDDLFAKAVVFNDGKTKVAMVVCDLLGLPRTVVVEARQLIEQKTGIPADHVMISATHTHTGPVIPGDSEIDNLVIGNDKHCQEYVRQLPKWIAESVEKADKQASAARVSFGSDKESGISFIRRFRMKDGSVAWNPGKLNPNIIQPIGTIDPQVNVVSVDSFGNPTPTSKPMLTYVNFANHLDTTGGLLVSADYPATLAKRLADYKGQGMLTMFANGTCGNINHLDVHSATPQSGPEEAKRIGTILAGAVLKAYLHLTPVQDTTLQVRRETVSLPLAPYTENELREARKIVARNGANATFLEQVKAYRIVDVANQKGKPLDVDVQVIALGRDIAWVALPGEVFVELGKSIKAKSPFRQTNVIELSNGYCYYIPNRSAYAEGQYEVVTSRYAEGAGEMLTATASRLLDELFRSAAEKR
jgi:hypothetical protein